MSDQSGFWSRGPKFNPAGIALTGGTITGTNVPYSLLKTCIPFIYASSGTMGNNGALSALTALPATYSDGCYIHLPASAISAGSSAGWYYAVMSSTTAGTVFNNTYTTGTPTIPSSPTAFATTGPGAYTGETGEVNGIIATVPAGALGSVGALKANAFWQYTNTAAQNKTLIQRFGGGAGVGSLLVNAVRTTEVRSRTIGDLYNLSTGVQRGAGIELIAGVASSIPAPVRMAVDTTAAQGFYTNMNKAVATDNVIVEYLDVALQM